LLPQSYFLPPAAADPLAAGAALAGDGGCFAAAVLLASALADVSGAAVALAVALGAAVASTVAVLAAVSVVFGAALVLVPSAVGVGPLQAHRVAKVTLVTKMVLARFMDSALCPNVRCEATGSERNESRI